MALCALITQKVMKNANIGAGLMINLRPKIGKNIAGIVIRKTTHLSPKAFPQFGKNKSHSWDFDRARASDAPEISIIPRLSNFVKSFS